MIQKNRRQEVTAILFAVVMVVSVLAIITVSAEVSPPVVKAKLSPAESIEVNKSVYVPVHPPKVDVVFAVDLTGSMSEELGQVKSHIIDIIGNLSELSGVDLQVGLVSHVDYSGYYESCNYSSGYGYSDDWPFRVEHSVTSNFSSVIDAVWNMTLHSGGDGPQDYARVMWESAQNDSGIGYRYDAFKLLVFFLDDVPHDCNINEGVPDTTGDWSTGVDPGRNGVIDGYLGTGGDDIDLQNNAIADMISNHVHQITLFSGDNTSYKYWEYWSELTGGSAFLLDNMGNPPSGLDLPTVIRDLVENVTARPVRVTPVPLDCDPIVITFDPPSSEPVSGDTNLTFTETISIPEGTATGNYCCRVEFRADGAVIGVQKDCVTVPPSMPETIKPPKYTVESNPYDICVCEKALHAVDTSNPWGWWLAQPCLCPKKDRTFWYEDVCTAKKAWGYYWAFTWHNLCANFPDDATATGNPWPMDTTQILTLENETIEII